MRNRETERRGMVDTNSVFILAGIVSCDLSRNFKLHRGVERIEVMCKKVLSME